jgi:enediyne biosynthesis protein E4
VGGHFRFAERGLVSGTARDGGGSPNGSMGVDAADYDGSGRPSLFVTNYENELHALYRNECQGDRILFQYASTAAGIGSLGQSTVGWGAGFLDLDHHGWEDLFIATGHAIRYPPRSGRDPRQRPILLRNRDGKFENISPEGGPYFRTTHLARGVALGDLDDDGRVDLVISHLNDPVVLLRNEAATDNHWLGVELIGRDRADVVGARLILECEGRKQTRFAKGGGSYASSGDRRHVFGLGQATKVGRLTVIWPNGERQHREGLAIDRYHRLVQGSE